MNETRIAEIRPSEESLKKATELVHRGGRVRPTVYRGGITESSVLTIALALDEAKAERTEECAAIADKHRCSLDNKWNRGLGPAGEGLAEVAEDIACEIRSLTQKDTRPNAE